MARLKNILPLFCAAILALAPLAGCSTTSRLGEDEMLYTGMKLKVEAPKGLRIPADLMSVLSSTVDVKPNNPLPFITPYIRSPFPIGLWVYNGIPDSVGGIRGWIYNRFAEPPVLVSDAHPETRLKAMEGILADNGFFGSRGSFQIDTAANHKKGRIIYSLALPKPYLIDSIQYIGENHGKLGLKIDSLARLSKYLLRGERFAVDSLISERVKIANSLRNSGYYFFRPEYIEYLADSIISPHAVTLRISLADNTPSIAKLQFRTGNVYTVVSRNSLEEVGVADTIHTQKGEVVVYRPAHLRKNVIPECITFRKGRLFSVRDMDRTQNRLARLGIFNNIQIIPMPLDTTPENPRLDVMISCQFDRPIEGSLQANIVSKSNSYFGPGLEASVTNNNTFGGGEKLTLSLSASYEWQTGNQRSNVFNSYEFGAKSSLKIPRLLAPSFIPRTNRDLNWTTFTLGADFMNRPRYFKLADFYASVGYEWRSSRNIVNQFTPFKINYNKLMSSTAQFDSIMNQNLAVREGFKNQFIPQMNYTFILDKFCERARINGINLRLSATEGGNLADGIYSLFGVKGEKKLFDIPFSQFIKGEGQLVYSRRLVRGQEQWLVSRILVGAAHAYGNSSIVPYSEQFYIGGANSIRAFTVRSIGPGSYKPSENSPESYFNRTGTFKFEMNSEFRFPIVSVLNGALFIDTGNIWLLKPEYNASGLPLRPGGELKAKTFLKDLALGTGVGLRVDIGMMVFRADLGYGLHAPYDTGRPGYFNIKFRNAFALHLAIGYPF